MVDENKVKEVLNYIEELINKGLKINDIQLKFLSIISDKERLYWNYVIKKKFNNANSKFIIPYRKFTYNEKEYSFNFQVKDRVCQCINNFEKCKYYSRGIPELKYEYGIYNGEIGYIRHIEKSGEKFIFLIDFYGKTAKYSEDELNQLYPAWVAPRHCNDIKDIKYTIII